MPVDREVLELYRQAQIDKIDVRQYTPPGPVASSFMRDREHSARFLMGPFGSGKTNVTIFDKLTLGTEMPKCTRGQFAGHRLYRNIEVRDTYSNLWDTTIRSWWSWFGPDIGLWTGSVGRRAIHQLTFDQPDGSRLHFEMIFLAVQDMDAETAFRGLEYTTANMGEADLLAPEVLTYLLGRATQQRFPPKRFFEPGTQYYTGVTGDLNPPDTDSWIYKLFEETRPEGHKMYKQPSGRGPHGENKDYIARETYEKMARENAYRPDYVKRMIDGQYGPSRDGDPVFPEYDDATHCGDQDLAPIPDIPLRLGFDQGVRGPAMVVAQWTPQGQLRQIDELCPGRIGPTGFGRECKLLLETRYRGYPIERATGDPRGFDGGDTETGDKSMFEIVGEVMDIIIWPAETNELHARQDGVRQLLRYQIAPHKPAFVISRRCAKTRKGFNSHYRYRKRRGVEATTDPVPEKNEFSNPHDALQYLVMDLVGLEGIKRGELMGGRGDKLKLAGDDDDDVGRTVDLDTNFSVW